MNIIPGGEPFLFPGGRTGCLLVHGFTATPQVMRPLGLRLSREGHTVLGIRLPGHATEPADLARVSWRDWELAFEEGVHLLRGMCEKVILVGHSTGGTLALNFAGREAVDGLAVISSLLHLPEDKNFALLRKLPYPVRLRIFRWVARRKPFVDKGQSAWYDREAQAAYLSYPVNPVNAVIELRLLLGEVDKVIGSVTCPALVIHSINDEKIPFANAEEILRRLGSADKRLVRLENCGHVAPLDAGRERVLDEIAEFVRRLA
jgi:carboxylesterase